MGHLAKVFFSKKKNFILQVRALLDGFDFEIWTFEQDSFFTNKIIFTSKIFIIN